MGKQTDNNSRNSADDYELKVLIDKCNVCHSNLDTDHHKVCKHHGEAMKASHSRPISSRCSTGAGATEKSRTSDASDGRPSQL